MRLYPRDAQTGVLTRIQYAESSRQYRSHSWRIFPRDKYIFVKNHLLGFIFFSFLQSAIDMHEHALAQFK